jgi:hypothetical protein
LNANERLNNASEASIIIGIHNNTTDIDSTVTVTSPFELDPPAYIDSVPHYDEMRFYSNTRPTLTPMGHKLLHISQSKLMDLDTPLMGREEGTSLWKGVVVREAIKSAWRSVEEGVEGGSGLTDWRAQSAMGLDVIGEDDEDEDERGDKEERWFDGLLEGLEDDVEAEHEWVESSVTIPAFEDEFEEDGIMAFTLPVLSPRAEPNTLVEVVEVEDDIPLTLTPLSSPPTPILSGMLLTPTSPSSSDSSYAPSSPCSSLDYDSDFEECSDSFLLPPPLHRSISSASSSDGCECCITPPPVGCEELAVDIEGKDEIGIERSEGMEVLGLGLDLRGGSFRVGLR